MLLLLASVQVWGNVDIVDIEGVPYVSWCDGQAFIAACPSGIPSSTLALGNTDPGYDYATLCLTSSNSESRLIAACDPYPYWLPDYIDTIYVIDPENLTIINQRSLNCMDLGLGPGFAPDHINLIRYSDGSDTVTMMAKISNTATDAGGVYVASAIISCPDTGDITLRDTLSKYTGYGGWGPDILGPVEVPGLEPLSMSCHAAWNPMYFEAWIRSHLQKEEPGNTDTDGEMCSFGIWGYNDDHSSDLYITALGSCGTEAVGIWADSSGIQYYSVFTDDLIPDGTFEFPFSQPEPATPAAMSRNTSDDGMLLVWSIGGEIRVRHWLGEWNDFDHIVASGVDLVEGSNIAVCSVEDGYWVAWFSPDLKNEPELVFVDRVMVTGIASGEETEQLRLALSPSSNPFSGSLRVTIEGSPLPESLQIFDLTGRLVRELDDGSESGTFVWNGRNSQGEDVPAGAYFLRVYSSGFYAGITVLRL